MERFKGENQKRIQGTLDNQLREQRHMNIAQIGNTWLALGICFACHLQLRLYCDRGQNDILREV
jgi:hypothetical protein